MMKPQNAEPKNAYREELRMTKSELVISFMEEVFNNGNKQAIDKYLREDYIQHSPHAETGREGFKKFAEHFLSLKPHMQIVKIAENEDTVFVFFKCTLAGGAVNKVVDIYRIEDGRIAEHWDVVEHNVQEITPAHNNGLF